MHHIRRRFVAALAACGIFAATTGPSAAEGFDLWLRDFRAEAETQGISARTLDTVLPGLAPIPRVIELDRRQPESRSSFRDYLDRIVSDRRVREGRQLRDRHRAALQQAAERYGVPAAVVVALWGVESTYGSYKGDYDVLAALATLAHDGRRGAYFRGELLNALRIVDTGAAPVEALRGSWAGAMGQIQFMPSSFLRYAVDGDADGHRDIWNNPADVFASAANYLAANGWRPGEPWGRRVKLSRPVDPALAGTKVTKPLADWRKLGIVEADGRPLKGAATVPASLVMPDGPGGPTFLVFENFQVLLRWNRSSYFATSVGLLADRIGGH